MLAIGFGISTLKNEYYRKNIIYILSILQFLTETPNLLIANPNTENMAKINLDINGKRQTLDIDPDTPVLWVLREHLNLVGTKYGCGIAQCGACTIHLDGTAVRSCVLPVSGVGDQKITTIEGLSDQGDHPVQKAWLEHDVAQCGYCQAGQIMNAAALLKNNPSPTDEEIESAMDGNICRCATYLRIKAAIKSAAQS